MRQREKQKRSILSIFAEKIETMNIRKLSFFTFMAFLCGVTVYASPMTSPNGKLTMDIKDGQFVISYQGQQVLKMLDAEAAQPLKAMKAKKVKADYTMIEGKRSHCTNVANEYRVGAMTLRLYNDGLAYRYESPVKEQAAYVIPVGMKSCGHIVTAEAFHRESYCIFEVFVNGSLTAAFFRIGNYFI